MSKEIVSIEHIARSIFAIRGQTVMLDFDLAALYGVPTGHLNRAVKRNIGRFPVDFMFQLGAQEARNLKCQFGISSWGGRRAFPYAFTEQGVAMLSSVWVAHASRVWVSASRRNNLSLGVFPPLKPLQSPQWRDTIASTRDACATRQ